MDEGGYESREGRTAPHASPIARVLLLAALLCAAAANAHVVRFDDVIRAHPIDPAKARR